jgi:predicted esterase
MRRIAVVCGLVLLVCAVAQGDVIYTTDGRKITGKIVGEDTDTVTIKARYGGEITLDRMDIDRIERGKLPEEVYEEKAKALKDSDAQGHCELGQWCKKNGLSAQAKKEFQKAIAANPEHEAARKALGYLKREGKWVLPSREKEKTEARAKHSGLPSAQLAKILKTVGNAVKSGTLSDSAKKKLESLEGLSKKDFEKVAQKIAAWKTYKAQNQEDFIIQAAGMQAYVHLPPKYNPKKSYPMIITLHGAGGTGQNLRDAWANTKTDWGRKVRAGYIVVGATDRSPRRGAQWWQWPQGKDVYDLLEHLKKSYNVDTNRVILNGFSNGGHSTWSLGMKQPSLFTALAPSAGGPVGDSARLDLELIASLANLPVHWVHSADDRICPAASAQRVMARYKQLGYKNIIHKQFDSGGHVAHVEYWGVIFKWFNKLERDMYPKKVVFISDHEELDTAYWVRLGGITKRAKVTGEIKGSTIKLKVENATKVTLFLSDKMLNLDKPIKVEINGKKKFSGTIKRSACVAVEEALKRNDRGAVFAASLELDIP